MADKVKSSAEGRQLHRKVEVRGADRDVKTTRAFDESNRVDEMPSRSASTSKKLAKANEERREELAGEENKQV